MAKKGIDVPQPWQLSDVCTSTPRIPQAANCFLIVLSVNYSVINIVGRCQVINIIDTVDDRLI